MSWGSKVAAAISAAMVCLALLFPAQDFDLFTFVGVVQRYDHSAEVALERTKLELRQSLTEERYRWITGAGDPPGYAYAVATRPEVFDAQLRWFYGRPLFTRLAWLLTKLGAPTPHALHGISLVSGGLSAFVLFRLTRVLDPNQRGSQSPLDYSAWKKRVQISEQLFVDALRLSVWAFLLLTTNVWGLARSPLSDGFAMLLVALGFDAAISSSATVARGERDPVIPWRAFLLLFVSITARVDNALYVLALAAFLLLVEFFVDAKVRAKTVAFAIVSGASATALAFWLNRRSYGIRKLIYFRRVFLERLPAEAEMPLPFSKYVSVVLRVLGELHVMEILLVLVFLAWVFCKKRELRQEPAAMLGFLMLPLSAMRFLLFPDFSGRFFVIPFSLFVLAVVVSAIPRPAVATG